MQAHLKKDYITVIYILSWPDYTSAKSLYTIHLHTESAPEHLSHICSPSPFFTVHIYRIQRHYLFMFEISLLSSQIYRTLK